MLEFQPWGSVAPKLGLEPATLRPAAIPRAYNRGVLGGDHAIGSGD